MDKIEKICQEINRKMHEVNAIHGYWDGNLCGCCGIASQILYETLHLLGHTDATLCFGKYKWSPHCFVRVGFRIYDPTAEQFQLEGFSFGPNDKEIFHEYIVKELDGDALEMLALWDPEQNPSTFQYLVDQTVVELLGMFSDKDTYLENTDGPQTVYC